MTTYVEYSVSAGHGTLVEHGVVSGPYPQGMFAHVAGLRMDHTARIDCPHGVIFTGSRITPERYSEFISIHGSEKAI